MNEKIFYQDFLYRNMKVTKEGCPDIDYSYSNYVTNCKVLNMGRNQKDKRLKILLSDLMAITKEEKWNLLEQRAEMLDELFIVDDIDLQNPELEEYKIFFIKTYLWKLGKFCQCYVIWRQD